jgi:hypothetical protein
MSKNLKNRVEKLEARQPQPHPEEPLDLSKFSPEEQALIKKAEETFERLNRMKDPGSRFGTENATEEDQRVLVAAAELVAERRRQREEQYRQIVTSYFAELPANEVKKAAMEAKVILEELKNQRENGR